MNRHRQKNFLRLLFVFGLLLFFPLIRKKPYKETNEWLIVFFLKGYLSSILDNIINKLGYVKYPINMFKFFDISVLFSYLLYPLLCVYYNQVTKNSNLAGILLKVLFFSLPVSIFEVILEKNTKLIQYCKGWNGVVSFISLTFTFWFVRGMMSLVRLLNKSTSEDLS